MNTDDDGRRFHAWGVRITDMDGVVEHDMQTFSTRKEARMRAREWCDVWGTHYATPVKVTVSECATKGD